MKKLIFLLLVLVILFPLGAKYSPSFTLNAGFDTLFYNSNAYPSLRAGLELSPVSYRINRVTFSIPLSINYVRESLSRGGLLSPSFYKNGVGIEVLLDNNRYGGSIAVFYGYEHYREERALMKYIEARAGFHLLLDSHISLFVPVSYTYTPSGDEVSISLGVRIGGEI